MPDVRVRDLDEGIVLLLKDQAKKKHQSLQASLKALLTEAAMKPRRELIARLEAHHQRMRETCGVLPDSVDIIREERDRIG
jgi:plasmid stability protein